MKVSNLVLIGLLNVLCAGSSFAADGVIKEDQTKIVQDNVDLKQSKVSVEQAKTQLKATSQIMKKNAL